MKELIKFIGEFIILLLIIVAIAMTLLNTT